MNRLASRELFLYSPTTRRLRYRTLFHTESQITQLSRAQAFHACDECVCFFLCLCNRFILRAHRRRMVSRSNYVHTTFEATVYRGHTRFISDRLIGYMISRGAKYRRHIFNTFYNIKTTTWSTISSVLLLSKLKKSKKDNI